MKKFSALVFEINTQKDEDLATLWVAITEDESLRTLVPLDLDEKFDALGPMASSQAEAVTAVIKKMMSQLGIECVEHTVADD